MQHGIQLMVNFTLKKINIYLTKWIYIFVEQWLATAATNGAVVLWNMAKCIKQETVYYDHKRTVNKVAFHGSEMNMLLSGSQDGTMKYFDIRMKTASMTFVRY